MQISICANYILDDKRINVKLIKYKYVVLQKNFHTIMKKYKNYKEYCYILTERRSQILYKVFVIFILRDLRLELPSKI